MQPQVIPAPPAPDVGKTAEESFQAQLKYNLPLAQNALDIQRQLGPGFAQSQYETVAQFSPLYKAMLMQLHPELASFQTQVNQRLNTPSGYTPEQQAAIDAIRNREQERGLRGIREGANLGGTLYGGRRQQAEQDYLTRQGQAYTAQDIAFQQQQQAANQQALVTLLQLTNPQVQQPAVPQYGQSVAPGGDALYSALVANQGNFGVLQGQPGQPGLAGPLIGAGATLGAAKLFVMCLPGHTVVETADGSQPIQDLAADTILADGSQVFYKAAYAPQETIFVRLEFEDGTSVETCDAHLVAGRPMVAWEVGETPGDKRIRARTVTVRREPTYDILTTALDGGYTCQGVRVASMIPLMHRLAQQLQEVA